MSTLPNSLVRGRILPLAAMIFFFLIADIVAFQFIDKPGLARYFSFGVIQAQAGLLCILAGAMGRSWVSSFLMTATLAITFGLVSVLTVLGFERLPPVEIATLVFALFPPLLFCGCVPFLLLRCLFGMHLSRRSTEFIDPYSLRMGDFFLAMTIIASQLAMANAQLGLDNNGGGELLFAAVAAVLASSITVVPVCFFYFRSSTRRGQFVVLFLFAMLGLLASGVYLIGCELWSGNDIWSAIFVYQPVSMYLYLLTSIVLFTLGLMVIHASGYRWRSLAKVNEPIETPSGYRTSNRVAAAVIVLASVALNISFSYIKRGRITMAETLDHLNSSFLLEGGYVEHDGPETVSLQVPPNSDFSNLDLNQFRGIARVSLSGSRISESTLDWIAQSRTLYDIDLSKTDFSDARAKQFVRKRGLMKLSLAGTQLTVKGINDVLAGVSIFKLDIGELHLDDQAIAQLKIDKTKGLILRGNPITDQSLEHLTSLQYLDISNTKCTGSELGRLTQVGSLILDGTLVDDSAISRLVASNSGFTRISLRDTQVTDAVFQTLTQCTNLQELELGDGEITAAGLVAASLPAIDRLAINSRKFNGTLFASWTPSVRCLDMSHSGVSDADIHHLGKIGQGNELRELSLAYCDITDDSLETLVAMNWSKLDLTGTKVTATAVAELFPNSTAVYLSPAQCSDDQLAEPNPKGPLRIGLRFDAPRY